MLFRRISCFFFSERCRPSSRGTQSPFFAYGEQVKAKRIIRNDGTYAGKEIGDILAKKGEEGYVVSIGTFLQQFYIYGVEFLSSGRPECELGWWRSCKAKSGRPVLRK